MWPIFLIIFGVSFLVLFIIDPKEYGVLIPAGILLFIGVTKLLKKMHYWEVYDVVIKLWPLIFVIVGLGIIINSLRKNVT